MLELDECNQLLVAKHFSDDNLTIALSNHDVLADTVTAVFGASPEHPLRSRSVSPANCCDTPGIPSVAVLDDADRVQPRPREEDQPPLHDSGVIVHPVGPNDSFAGVALRYGVSIAALRRANRLWPSDPIHLRTELFIPRGDALYAGRRLTSSASAVSLLRTTTGPMSNSSPDFITPSLVAARSMFLSMLPGRLSLESLSSKASVSEDLELDDFRTARAHERFTADTSFAQDGVELFTLDTPHAEYKKPLPSHVPSPPAHSQRLDHDPLRHMHLPPVAPLPAVSLEHLPRKHPFAAFPIRTSQLEPEPAMELPVRRSRV